MSGYGTHGRKVRPYTPISRTPSVGRPQCIATMESQNLKYPQST